MITLEELTEEILLPRSKSVIKRGKDLAPTAYILIGDNELHTMGLNLSNQAEKMTSVFMVHQYARQNNARIVAFAMEGWSAAVQEEKVQEELRNGVKRIRDLKSRQEVLIISAIDRTTNTRTSMMVPIIRKGKAIKFGEVMTTEKEKSIFLDGLEETTH